MSTTACVIMIVVGAAMFIGSKLIRIEDDPASPTPARKKSRDECDYDG